MLKSVCLKSENEENTWYSVNSFAVDIVRFLKDRVASVVLDWIALLGTTGFCILLFRSQGSCEVQREAFDNLDSFVSKKSAF